MTLLSALGFAIVLPTRAAQSSLSFKTTSAGTISGLTNARYGIITSYGGRFVKRVGVLQGNLQYLVNGKIILVPANQYKARIGDVITWRIV